MINLKKLLAAVMSLAMVATVVPTKVEAETYNYCDSKTNVKYLQLLQRFEDAELDIDDLKLKDVFSVSEDGKVYTVEDVLSGKNNVKLGDDLVQAPEVLAAYKACTYPADETATWLLGFVKGVSTLEKYIYEMEDLLIEEESEYILQTVVDDFDDVVAKEATKDGAWVEEVKDYDYAREMYAALTNEDEVYLGNISEAHVEALDTYLDVLEEKIDEYTEDNADAIVKQYVVALKDVTLYGTTTVADFIAEENEGKVSYKNLTKFSAAVDNIVDDKAKTTEGTKLVSIAKYDDVADEDAVAEIMEALEEAVAGMEEVKDLTSTKKPSYKAFDKAYDDTKTGLATLLAAEDKEAFADAIKTVDTDVLEAMVEYYEEVVSEFYYIDITQRANGTYRANEKATDLTKYLVNNNLAGEQYLDEFKNLGEALVNAKEDDETYLDIALGRAAKVEEALEAITNGIKNVTVKNLNTKNAEKVVAADEALTALTTTYAGNLTDKQQAVVDKNERNVETLYTYMLFNGIATVVPNGWVELENGNWDYYVEGVAFTGWVAAGSDWYYVKNGHMLRNSWIAKDATGAVWYYVGNNGAMVSNTVVDGYTINANGEWVK